MRRALQRALADARVCRFQVFIELSFGAPRLLPALRRHGYGTVHFSPALLNGLDTIYSWISSGIDLGVRIHMSNSMFNCVHNDAPKTAVSAKIVLAVLRACVKFRIPSAVQFAPAYNQHMLAQRLPNPSSDFTDDMCQHGSRVRFSVRTLWYNTNPDLLGRKCFGHNFRCSADSRRHSHMRPHLFDYVFHEFYELCAKTIANAAQNVKLQNSILASIS